MSYGRSLSYLSTAVEEQLGDVADLIPSGFIARALNEGQRRYEPMLLRPMSAAITWADDAMNVALPTDFVELVTVAPDDTIYSFPKQTRLHGTTMLFYEKRVAFAGTLYYLAHYPDITSTVDCLLPQVAADGLISYALYKSWKRIASNRTDYRRYATLVNNQTDIRDLEALSEAHYNDWVEARDATALVRDIEPAYGYE